MGSTEGKNGVVRSPVIAWVKGEYQTALWRPNGGISPSRSWSASAGGNAIYRVWWEGGFEEDVRGVLRQSVSDDP